MQNTLQEFMLLGLVPGTNIELSLEAFVLVVFSMVLAIELFRLYALHYYGFRAKRLHHKVEKLLVRNGLL
ncbi:MAG: hypothetical protein QG629_794 [Patescibacteria group bacterium]|nr:hypothetical protein [Candidatus Saccharibacteria bacterium]MDQ5963711.1 hypothetical protein [Patescibacteria group bacterium]